MERLLLQLQGLVNALRIVGKSMTEIKVVANGAGAAGIAIIKLLYSYGVRDIIMCDTKGAIYEGRPHGMNEIKEQVANCYKSRESIRITCRCYWVQMYLSVFLLLVH